MTIYRAVSEHGAEYVIDTVARTWICGHDICHLHKMSVVERTYDGGEWSTDLFGLPEAEAPVVGKALFLWGGHMSDWRLSTDVVSVEIVEGS